MAGEGTPVVRPLPWWLLRPYAVALGAALAGAPLLWLARNLASDEVFFRRTERLGTEAAYEKYVARGWLHVGQARRDLPRVALDEARRKGTPEALHAFLGRHKGSPLQQEARATLDGLYLRLLKADSPVPGPKDPVAVDELVRLLGRASPSDVNPVALAGFIPAKPGGAECGKAWKARLAAEATPATSLMARALLRGSCPGFLAQLLDGDRALLGPHRAAVEQELSAPAPTTELTLRQLRDYRTVKAHAASFSPDLGGRMVEAVRGSTWAPADGPTGLQLEALGSALDADPRLARAVLDYLERHAGRWPAPGTTMTTPVERKHRLDLLAFARRVEGLGRADLASRMARPAEAAFRAEIDAVAKKPMAEITRFLDTGPANPLVVELFDRLAAGGQPVLACTFVGGKGAGASAIRARLQAAAGARMQIVPCDVAACDRLPRQVRVRTSTSGNNYCYDKPYLGLAGCRLPGREMKVTLTYVEGGRVVGTDVVRAETPAVVTYRTSGALDFGPSASDVESATVGELNRAIEAARLRVPF